jgi:hypothetical protein
MGDINGGSGYGGQRSYAPAQRYPMSGGGMGGAYPASFDMAPINQNMAAPYGGGTGQGAPGDYAQGPGAGFGPLRDLSRSLSRSHGIYTPGGPDQGGVSSGGRGSAGTFADALNTFGANLARQRSGGSPPGTYDQWGGQNRWQQMVRDQSVSPMSQRGQWSSQGGNRGMPKS